MNAPEADRLERVDYQTDPSRYRHWRLTFDAPVATLAMDVAEEGGLRPGYKLKLNSYDLGVDIELADALNRIRFEHPEVRTVVLTSLRSASLLRRQHLHARPVIARVEGQLLQVHQRDAQRHRGFQRLFRAEVPRRRQRRVRRRRLRLALACDEIILVDDRSSTVSLPEVPLSACCPAPAD